LFSSLFAMEAFQGPKYVQEITANALPWFSHDVIKNICDFDCELRYARSFGDKKSRIGAIISPKSGHVFVWGGPAAEIYTLNGRFVGKFRPQIENGSDLCPRSMVFDTNGELYVIGMWQCRVYVFKEDGILIRSWSLEFKNKIPEKPSCLALDGQGCIYVATSQENNVNYGSKSSVYKFGLSGARISQIERGTIFSPKTEPELHAAGLAVGQGKTYVHLPYSRSVSVHSDTDMVRLKHAMPMVYNKPECVLTPFGSTLALDIIGNLILADAISNSLHFWGETTYKVIEKAGPHKFIKVWGVSYCKTNRIMLVTNLDDRIDVFSY